MCYVLNYLAMAIVMNIIMLASEDTKKFSSSSYECPKIFIWGYLMIEFIAPINFILGYALLEAITRRFLPVVQTYTFAKQSVRIKIVTFRSKCLKAVVVTMDLLHISWAVFMQFLAHADPGGVLVCQEEFSTLYVVTVILMVLGYLSIARLLYLIFPHLLGYKFFQYKQRKDTH